MPQDALPESRAHRDVGWRTGDGCYRCIGAHRLRAVGSWTADRVRDRLCNCVHLVRAPSRTHRLNGADAEPFEPLSASPACRTGRRGPLAVAVTTGEFLVSAKRVWAQMASVDCIGVALSTLCTSSIMVSNLL